MCYIGGSEEESKEGEAMHLCCIYGAGLGVYILSGGFM